MAFPKLNFKSSGSPSSSPSRPLVISNFLFRSLQFVFALAVIGLYAKDLAAAHHEHKYTDSKWAYAVAVGTLAAVTSLVFSFPKSFYAFGWDIIIFILWVAVFGIFGKMFIHEDPEGNSGIKRMKNAVWIDLLNMLLWFITSIFGAVTFFFFRGGRSRFTGRATV